jgi:hypothetical protein
VFEKAKNDLHQATFASSASGISACSAAGGCNASRMIPEVCCSSPVILNSQTEGLPQGSPSAYPECAKEIPIRPRSHFSQSRVALPSDLGKRFGRKDLKLLNLRRFSK